jgi:flavin-dependent dehydrogenase
MSGNRIRTDVTVIGGGLAGTASAIHLAKAGLQVACIEPLAENNNIVGESLDWSAPELLRVLGLPMDRLIAEEIATWKKHVIVQTSDGCRHEYVPGNWLARSPWNVELRTLHVDRNRLRNALSEILLRHGVQPIQDKVAEIARTGSAVTAVTTEGGKEIESPWFIDASGFAASLLPRLFNLRAFASGPRKVAIWSYFTVADSIEGTTLYTDGVQTPYMDWVWEIPIHRNTISVGYVAPGETIRAMRRQGHSVEDIYRAGLGRHARFASLLEQTTEFSTRVTSFQCRAYGDIAGPNWLVVGEAASMVDPMTSNGVTAALRHADEASRLIIRSFRRRRLPYFAAAMYSRRVLALAKFFNGGIEKVVYEWPVRKTIGVGNAGEVYTIPAWSMNVVYSRFQPRDVLGTFLFCAALSSFRTAASILHWICSRLQPLPPSAADFAS